VLYNIAVGYTTAARASLALSTLPLQTMVVGAWRGELIMAAAALRMAFYNVWSRPFVQRSSALGFLTVGMGAGAAALAFIFWVLALERATPTRVANTMTVNPIAAGLLAAVLVNEPITVLAGIWIATTQPARV